MAEQDMHSQRLPLKEGMNGTGGGLNGMGSLNGTGSLNGGASQSQGGTSPSGRLTAEQNNLDYAIGGGYQGSLQQILADNVGQPRYCRFSCRFVKYSTQGRHLVPCRSQLYCFI